MAYEPVFQTWRTYPIEFVTSLGRALSFALDPHTPGRDAQPRHARHRRGDARTPYPAQGSGSHRGQESGPNPWQGRWSQLVGVGILLAAVIVLLWPGAPLALGLGALLAAGLILLILAIVLLLLLLLRRDRS